MQEIAHWAASKSRWILGAAAFNSMYDDAAITAYAQQTAKRPSVTAPDPLQGERVPYKRNTDTPRERIHSDLQDEEKREEAIAEVRSLAQDDRYHVRKWAQKVAREHGFSLNEPLEPIDLSMDDLPTSTREVIENPKIEKALAMIEDLIVDLDHDDPKIRNNALRKIWQIYEAIFEVSVTPMPNTYTNRLFQ